MADISAAQSEQGNQIEVQVFPTLVVGLGGSGCRIAKRLKKTIMADGGADLNVQFIGFDTEVRQQNSLDPSEAPLDHFIPLGGRAVHFDPKDASNAPILHWLPTDEAGNLLVGGAQLSSGIGARGQRLVGRFAYAYFAPSHWQVLRQAVDTTISLAQNPFIQRGSVRYRYQRGLAVYVIASFVGGTGSGTFIDAIAYLHRLTDQAGADLECRYHGVFLLPSVFDYQAIGVQQTTHRATAYACLKDLENLLSRDDPDILSFYYYGDSAPVPLTKKLLDTCYLVDRYATSGALRSDEDVFDLVATHLHTVISTPFGATSDAVLSNSPMVGRTDEHGGLCNYSAFGVVGMDFSPDTLASYCAARLGIEAIDQLLGDGISSEDAQKEAAAFMAEAGLSPTGPNAETELESVIKGRAGDAYTQSDAEERAKERPDRLAKELEESFNQFEAELNGGPILATLQSNLTLNLTMKPGDPDTREPEPGTAKPPELRMWRYKLIQRVDTLAQRIGLRAAKQVAEALLAELERERQRMQSAKGARAAEASEARQQFGNALSQLRNLTRLQQILNRNMKERKVSAVSARNSAVQTMLAAKVAEIAVRAYTDDTNGLIATTEGLIRECKLAEEGLSHARDTLASRVRAIDSNRAFDVSAGAPDRSCLMYDIVSFGWYSTMYASMSRRTEQLIAKLTPDKIVRHIATSGSNNLVGRIDAEARALYPELEQQHILDAMAGDATAGEERTQVFQQYMTEAAKRLGVFAPAVSRQGSASTYDYCVVMHPVHPDSNLADDFKNGALSAIRSAVPGAGAQVVAAPGPRNRVTITYMKHGIALNDQCFSSLPAWREAYQAERRRNKYLDVDKRWRKLPGPGEKNPAQLRERLFALGVAYGLIAQHGTTYYVNFAKQLCKLNSVATTPADAYEVDLKAVEDAIAAAESPADWFRALTDMPSSACTIPAQLLNKRLGSKRKIDERNKIATGRANAMRAFCNDEGEDYADVADAIATVVEAYLEQNGKANMLRELDWYRQQLEDTHASDDLKQQLRAEAALIAQVAEEIRQDGTLSLR